MFLRQFHYVTQAGLHYHNLPDVVITYGLNAYLLY